MHWGIAFDTPPTLTPQDPVPVVPALLQRPSRFPAYESGEAPFPFRTLEDAFLVEEHLQASEGTAELTPLHGELTSNVAPQCLQLQDAEGLEEEHRTGPQHVQDERKGGTEKKARVDHQVHGAGAEGEASRVGENREDGEVLRAAPASEDPETLDGEIDPEHLPPHTGQMKGVSAGAARQVQRHAGRREPGRGVPENRRRPVIIFPVAVGIALVPTGAPGWRG